MTGQELKRGGTKMPGYWESNAGIGTAERLIREVENTAAALEKMPTARDLFAAVVMHADLIGGEGHMKPEWCYQLADQMIAARDPKRP